MRIGPQRGSMRVEQTGSRICAIGRGLMSRPTLLMIDEPALGLAPRAVEKLSEALVEVNRSGVTILLVEQNINFAQRLGDTVAVMDNGRVVHSGTMAAFSADEALQQSLLGLAL